MQRTYLQLPPWLRRMVCLLRVNAAFALRTDLCTVPCRTVVIALCRLVIIALTQPYGLPVLPAVAEQRLGLLPPRLCRSASCCWFTFAKRNDLVPTFCQGRTERRCCRLPYRFAAFPRSGYHRFSRFPSLLVTKRILLPAFNAIPL